MSGPLAYIDPMSGTVVLQVILAAIVGVSAFFRHGIARLVGLMLGHKPKPTTHQPPAVHHKKAA